MKNSYRVLILVILSLLLAVFVYPEGFNKGIAYFNNKTSLKTPQLPVKPFQLGLDLLGGTHLLYEADLSGVEDGEVAMDGVRDVIERRVNFFGVSEPVVQVTGGNRLVVELAGIKDVGQAISLIGETPFLEFKEEKVDAAEIVQAQQNGQRLEEDPFMSTGLNGRHLKRVQVTFDQQTFQPQVSLELNEEGTKLFAEITKRNIGKTVAIFLDGQPISIPTVQTEIPDGQAVISGRFTPQEAKLLATRLNSGALPVPIKLVSQQTVGASLGADSLSKSLKAGVFGLVFLAVFMIAMYRLPGVVSVLALLIYSLIVLAVYKGLPVTLTLAGVAGFILTLGMAVDANVLIFARMKEELATGKTVAGAVNDGFHRAWLSIRDSHITTLLSALVLYLFTTSLVRGFALTLGIGTLVSLFTATFVTRLLLSAFVRSWAEKRRWLFG